MKEFKNYHPIVSFIYFVFVIGFSMFVMNPVCLTLSLVCAFAYSVVLKGKRAVKTNLMYMVPVIIGMTVINPVFNHGGETIIAYLPGGSPITVESIIYGLCTAITVVSVICWFSCYNTVMTSDKLMYLFGKIVPAMSLVISMTLRFVPRFSAQLKVVANAQKTMGRDVTSGNVIQRARHGLSILWIMVTWALENSIETADSMKSRGYGTPKRTAFSVFKLDKRDGAALFFVVLMGMYTLAGALTGGLYFRYFPSLNGGELTWFGVSVYGAYFLLCMCPLIIEAWEVRKWKAIKSKI